MLLLHGGTIRGGRGANFPVELMVRWWQEVHGVANVRDISDVLPDFSTNNARHITRTTWTAQQRAPPTSSSIGSTAVVTRCQPWRIR